MAIVNTEQLVQTSWDIYFYRQNCQEQISIINGWPEILYSVLLHYFKDSGYADWENLFIRFVRTNAKKFFGLEPIYNDANLVTLVHGQWIVPSVYPDIPVFSNNPKWSPKCVYPFWAGRELHWKLGIDSQEI